jgi:sulfate permease, SulP family
LPGHDDLTPSEPSGSPTAREPDAYADEAPFQQPRRAPFLHRAVPVSEELPNYRPRIAQRDLVAGLTVASLALPAAMAYAELAGLSPVHGLYALLAPAVVYALLGSCKQLVIGPEGSLTAIIAAAILPLAAAGSIAAAELAATLAALVGVFFLLARVLRLGWIADYFSRPVLLGYIHGVAVALIIGQLGKLLGLDIDATNPLPQLAEVVQELGDVSWTTLAVSVPALAVLIPFRFVAPRFPTPLVVVVAGLAVSAALDLADHGVAVVGEVPGGLPSIDVPTPPLGDVFAIVPAALGIFAVSFADEILTARAFAGKNGQHVRASQEMLTMSAANLAAGFTQAMPVGASGSRTAVADSLGVRTQVAGLVSAGTIAVIVLFFTGPIQNLPKAVLGAVIVGAAIGLIHSSAWRALWATDRFEFTIAAVTAGGVIAVGVLESLLFAVGLVVLDSVRRSARPHDAVLGWVDRLGRYGDVEIHRSARVVPGVVIYRLDDRLFFANARYVQGRVREAVRGAPTPARWVVFDAEAVTHVDSTGAEALSELVTDLRREGVTLVMAKLKRIPKQRFDESGLMETIGADRFYPTIAAAVEACTSAGAAASV